MAAAVRKAKELITSLGVIRKMPSKIPDGPKTPVRFVAVGESAGYWPGGPKFFDASSSTRTQSLPKPSEGQVNS